VGGGQMRRQHLTSYCQRCGSSSVSSGSSGTGGVGGAGDAGSGADLCAGQHGDLKIPRKCFVLDKIMSQSFLVSRRGTANGRADDAICQMDLPAKAAWAKLLNGGALPLQMFFRQPLDFSAMLTSTYF